MAYSVLINGIERVKDILNESIAIEDILNDQQNQCTLDLINSPQTGIVLNKQINVVDQQYLTITGNLNLGDGNRKAWAQRFTPTDPTLSRIKIYCNVASGAVTGDVTFSIVNDAGTQPGTTVYGTITIPCNTYKNYIYQTYIELTANLSAGTNYYIKAETSALESSGIHQHIIYGSVAGSANTCMYSTNGTTWTDNSSSGQIYFQTFGTEQASPAPFTTGKLNNGALMVGTSDYKLYAPVTDLFTTGDQSWSCWFNITAIPWTNSYLMNIYDGTSVIGIRQSNSAGNTSPWGLALSITGLTGDNQITAIYSEGWNHIVAIVDTVNSRRKMYLNGTSILDASYTGTITNQTGTKVFAIGTSQGATGGAVTFAGSYTSGTFDDIAIFHRVLTETEILALYNGGNGREIKQSSLYADPNLKGYWPLEDLNGLSGGYGIPETDEEIIITLDNSTVLFAGYITGVEMNKQESGQVVARITATDYTRLLDHNLVHKTYQDQTDKEIIEDLVNTYCSGLGITTTNVIEDITISQISFNYVQISEAIRKIAEMTGNNWYIDYDKDIHYFPLTTSTAPWNITSTSALYSNLTISKDATQLKNRVYVRGGTKLSDFTTYSTKGDGSARKFVVPDKPHDLTLTINSVSKTVGIKNIDTSGYDWYLNFQEKYLEQDTGGTVLSTSDVLTVTYKYDIPILVAIEDKDSILESGVHEFAIFDKSITTTQAARDRATAELTDYANSLVEGSFTTLENGFISGQYININLPDYDINANYIVQNVKAQSIGAGYFEYTIEIASAKTMGIIKFLIELLEANKNLIELDENEVVDELFEIADILISDSLLDALTIDSAGPNNTWCTADETSPATRARYDLFQWGA